MRNLPNERLTGQPRTPAKAGNQSNEKSGRDAGPGRRTHVPERSCILTRRSGSPDELIRLALGPDGVVAPDVGARAPGRGAWIAVNRDLLDAANQKGKLKGALARSFKSSEIHVAADLGERIAAALRQAALDRLGLEARGGTLLSGGDKIESAARAGRVHLLIHAADAGEDGCKRLNAAWRIGGGPTPQLIDDVAAGSAERLERDQTRGLVFPEGRTILSMALGRENVVHVALIDPAAASRVQRAIARWQTFIDPRAGFSGPSAAAQRHAADAAETNAADANVTDANANDEGLE